MGGVARTIAIALGSNLGDRARHLAFATERLAATLDGLRVSSLLETMPEGTPDRQPLYLNAAAVGRSDLPARALLDLLMTIEAEQGRERRYANAPRTLDLDLILYGGDTVTEPGLVVPHPRFRERRFVLGPLCEIAPHLVDPVTGLTVRQLLDRLR
jgi:2-amino-4-hydroxy-6-hydroxymethyldihydropteridine diphosphokinase